ncbi:MAG TPA: SDR family NAD(P)-dependent oxidoreductase [Bryobacteraceae bacterium]|nr:SDR family NAD(P)-dependent oxidoreductase [Bryobacteraceae bacterium]
MNSLKNKVVLITGAGAGIGRAVALRLAESEASVVVTGRRVQRLKSLTKSREHLDFVVTDAANPDDAPRLNDTVIERWGCVDVLVNTAGAGALLPVENCNHGGDKRNICGKCLRSISISYFPSQN